RTEADAPIGHACGDRLGDQSLLADEPGVRAIVVDTDRAAHRKDAGKRAPVGQPLVLVEQDAEEGDASPEQLVLVDPRRLAAGVLQYEDRPVLGAVAHCAAV